MIRGWSDRRVRQVSDDNLVKAKNIACWFRLIKLLSRVITNTILHIVAMIFVINHANNVIIREVALFLIIISFSFLVIKYVQDSSNIRRFVDDKFRKTISNNNTTKH